MSHQSLSLFPTPVAVFNLGRDFTESEMSCVRRLLESTTQNIGNRHTQDRFVLHHDALMNIARFCQESVFAFGAQMLQVQDGLPAVTQSWLNLATKGQWHHVHHHPNSLWSGVLFIKTNDNDRIVFHRREPLSGSFKLDQTAFNNYNSDTWWLPNNEGELLLFPSTFQHSVPATEGDERITLSFNTFPTTSIGTVDSLTYLPIGSQSSSTHS